MAGKPELRLGCGEGNNLDPETLVRFQVVIISQWMHTCYSLK